MKAGMITENTKYLFKDLIAPQAFTALNQGQPVIAIGLTHRNTPIGALTGVIESEDIFNITSLYVVPWQRRHHGGTMLINALINLLESEDLGIALLSYTENDSQSDVLTLFMESLEAYETNCFDKLYLGSIGSFYESRIFANDTFNKNILPLQYLNSNQSMHVPDSIISVSTFGGVALSNLKPIKNLSYVMMQNNYPSGFLLSGSAKWHGKEALVCALSSPDQDDAALLLSNFISGCRDNYPPDTTILLHAADDSYDELLSSIGNIRNIQHNYIF